MPFRNVYFRQAELDLINREDEGFIRRAVLKELYEPDELKPEEVVEMLDKVSGISEYAKGPVKEELARNVAESTPGVSIGLTPKSRGGFMCKECGQPKTAGRCINSNCKLKGKLQ